MVINVTEKKKVGILQEASSQAVLEK